jgi:hypothetical protein
MTLAAGILTLALAQASEARPWALVQRALSESTAIRVEVVDARLALPEGCVARHITAVQPVERSGVVGLKASGEGPHGPCQGRGWARVRAFAPVWVVTEARRMGEGLGDAVAREEREVAGPVRPLASIPSGARARVNLSRGTVLEARHLRDGTPAPGEPVKVVVQVGAVRLEQPAVAVRCASEACARLANGAHVEGRFADGKLLVTP